MLLEITLIIAGIALVLMGANWFTDGASGLARRLKVSELVIGLTVVALGTSLPEFMVSFLSVLQGSADMSVGNSRLQTDEIAIRKVDRTIQPLYGLRYENNLRIIPP